MKTMNNNTLSPAPRQKPVACRQPLHPIQRVGQRNYVANFPEIQWRMLSGNVAVKQARFIPIWRYCFLLTTVLLWLLPNCVFAQDDRVQSFKEQLNNNAPIKSLRYTEIDCETHRQRQFFAAIAANGFFLREYTSSEDPTVPISFEKIPQSPNFHGRNKDLSWQINGLQITEAYKSDPIPNSYNLGSDTAERAIAIMLNLGVPSVRHGTFKWKNVTNFSVRVNSDIKIKRESDGAVMTNMNGYITLRDGFVSELHIFGGTAHYEYATNSAVPFGVPTKIIIGKSSSECKTIYLINELTYGRDEEMQHYFNPESKFSSVVLPTVVSVTNNIRKAISGGKLKLQPPPISSQSKVKTSAVRWLMWGTLVVPAILFFYTIRKRK